MRFLAALVLVLAVSAPSAKAEIVTIAADPWPPYISENHPEGGVSIQIIREALGRHGYEVELTIMPWARAILSVRRGQFDVLPDTWYTQERGEVLQFSEPYAVNKLKFIKRADDNFTYRGLESLEGKNVGIVRDYGYGKAFYQADFEREATSDLIVNLRKLARNRVDLAIADELVARYRVHEESPTLMEEIAFVDPPYSTEDLHVAVGKSNPRGQAIISAFNKGLAEMRRDGTLAAIMEANDLPLSVITD